MVLLLPVIVREIFSDFDRSRRYKCKHLLSLFKADNPIIRLNEETMKFMRIKCYYFVENKVKNCFRKINYTKVSLMDTGKTKIRCFSTVYIFIFAIL